MADTKSKSSKAGSEELKIPVKYIVSAAVLIIVLVLIFVLWNSGIFSGLVGGVSESKARAKLIDFFTTQVPDSNINIISSSKQGSFYEFIVDIDGERASLYVTTDGKYLVVQPIPLK